MTTTVTSSEIEGGTPQEFLTREELFALFSTPLGTTASTANTDSTASAAINANLKGMLYLLSNMAVLTANYVRGLTAAMTGTTSTSVIAAGGASVVNMITLVTVTNTHATVGTEVLIQDGNGGTTLYSIYAPALQTVGVKFDTPLATTANTALYAANVTTGSSTKVYASGYKE